MNTIKTDVCVIGAGSGGLTVASGAVQMGAKVVLIEAGKMGGDCLNYGCVPSKTLIHAGRVGMSYAGAMADVERAISTIAPHDSQERFEKLGCTVIRETARFEDENTIIAGDTRIEARRVVIATGSSPMVPPINGIDTVPYLTNETLFAQRETPEHLIIIGGGPIGIEMAFAHRSFGCEVTVVDGDAALGKDDPDAAKIVLDRLRGEGVTLMEGAKVEVVSPENGVTVRTSKGPVTGSHLLVAAGRKPNLDKLDLDKGNVLRTKTGVDVDDSLRSVSNKKVYAIGDAAGGMQFTHLAGYHGGVIIRSMLFGIPAKAKTAHIPRVTYGSPELAQIGLTEAEARKEHGDKLTVIREDLKSNDRAVTAGITEGFIKLMVHKGRPVGVTLVAPNAGDLIAPWALAMANNMKLSAMSNAVFPYPTLAEINKRAAGSYFSPKLFDSALVKTVVGLVQRWLP
ncbi:dihydrolipoyl dehydrogenase family protein [Marivivens aquimaris]|uniref:dihydrolipoyl dehydrogenase family protein n=1 Tax=Marivivens aquimaris TaxID=2774876 RepID=UPI001882337B|nr:FAD-dependent oxidoreductase [Marivivens aquimaris]